MTPWPFHSNAKATRIFGNICQGSIKSLTRLNTGSQMLGRKEMSKPLFEEIQYISMYILNYTFCYLVYHRHIEDHHYHNNIHYCMHQRYFPLYYIDNSQVDNCSILTLYSLTLHPLYDPSILSVVNYIVPLI